MGLKRVDSRSRKSRTLASFRNSWGESVVQEIFRDAEAEVVSKFLQRVPLDLKGLVNFSIFLEETAVLVYRSAPESSLMLMWPELSTSESGGCARDCFMF